MPVSLLELELNHYYVNSPTISLRVNITYFNLHYYY
jgi:hypothetical protein